jgi:hypothetical protein
MPWTCTKGNKKTEIKEIEPMLSRLEEDKKSPRGALGWKIEISHSKPRSGCHVLRQKGNKEPHARSDQSSATKCSGVYIKRAKKWRKLFLYSFPSKAESRNKNSIAKIMVERKRPG